MDPISAIGIVESSLCLAVQFGNAAKALNDVAGKYKNAKLTIKSLAQNLDILQLSWTQIGNWFKGRSEDRSLYGDSLTRRVKGFLEIGNLVMDALKHDLQAYDIDHPSFLQRSRLVWNENTLQGHQSRVRDQTLSMSLFLQAVNLPTPQATAQLLVESEAQFQKSNESAHSTDSIVPNRTSVATSQRDSYASGSSQEITEYRRLSFEKRLFMSRVYMRSSKNAMIKELSEVKTSFKRKITTTTADQTRMNWEAIRDQLEADSLLATSCDVSIGGNEHIKYGTFPQTDTRFSRGSKAASITGMTLDEELMWACKQGDSLRVKRLANRGLDLHVSFKEPKYLGMKGIHVAAMHGHINVIEALLSYGATVEDEEASFRSRPLHIAAKSGQGAMTKFLMQRGAQVDARNLHESQPIHEASSSGSIEIIDALIKAGTAIDCSDGAGRQPMHQASMIPNRSDVIIHLLRQGADIEAKASSGSRPLRLACTSDPTNLRTLILLGAKTDYDDGTESTLESAIRFDSKWAVEILLQHGADLNRQNNVGNTILHTLAGMEYLTSSRIGMCQMLLDNGAKLDLANNSGNRMLHCLAVRSSESTPITMASQELAELALDHGAEIDATNGDGMSPLYLALLWDNRRLSKLLLRRGARKLKETAVVRAGVQLTTPSRAHAPTYTVSIRRGLEGLEEQQRWSLSTQSFELSVDDGRYSRMVCEALGDDRASSSGGSRQ